MTSCSQELCEYWGGDGNVCQCALFDMNPSHPVPGGEVEREEVSPEELVNELAEKYVLYEGAGRQYVDHLLSRYRITRREGEE